MSRDRRKRSASSQQGRPTETPEQYARRYRRDMVWGTIGLVVFSLVLVLNFVLEVAPGLPLLPGGHSELYFVAALLGLGYAAWVRFDLGLNRRKRR